MDHQILDKPEEYDGLDKFRDTILAILPIPSAILSIIGSSAILYMAFSTRRQRKWTTYIRLLIGLSLCDIVSSVSLGLAAFMRRPQSHRVWAMGNDATCAAAGTLIQFSHSGLFYNGFLSWYFVMTARFRVKNSVIARRFEPMMHFISLGYPLVCAIVGAIYGFYSETSTGMGCWVNDYPKGCGDKPGQEKCKSGLIGYMFFGVPYMFSAACIVTNNLIIWLYVRKQRQPLLYKTTTLMKGTVHAKSSSLEDNNNNDENAINDSVESNGHMLSLDKDILLSTGSSSSDESVIMDLSVVAKKSRRLDDLIVKASGELLNETNSIKEPAKELGNRATNNKKDQTLRLQLVSSQAFLFVLSYAVCHTWHGLVLMVEGATEDEDEPKLMNDIYWLMVVNAILAPLQGLFNMLVFMRPRYVKARRQFPRETRAWAFRRAVLGDGVRPEQRGRRQKEKPVDADLNSAIAKGRANHAPTAISINDIDATKHMIPLPTSTILSSLTISLGDFDDQDEEKKTERTKGTFETYSNIPRFQFQSSLESIGRGLKAISELTESNFDPILHAPIEDNGLSTNGEDGLASSERRWSSSRFDEVRNDAAASSCLQLVAPRRFDSDCEIFHEDDELEDEDLKEEKEKKEMDSAADTPMSVSLRRKSLDSSSFRSYSSSISSSCSLIGFSDNDSEFGEDD